MNGEVLHALFRVGMFIVVASLLTLFWTPAGSGARTITWLSWAIGVLLLGVIAAAARWSNRRDRDLDL